jgi:hypothetical protein
VVADKRALTTKQPQWQATINDKSVWQIMMAATMRVRAARVMVTVMKMVGNKEGKSRKGHAIGNNGGMQ